MSEIKLHEPDAETSSAESGEVIQITDQKQNITDDTGALGKMQNEVRNVAGKFTDHEVQRVFNEQIGSDAEVLQVDITNHSQAAEVLSEIDSQKTAITNQGKKMRIFIDEALTSDSQVEKMRKDPAFEIVTNKKMNQLADEEVELEKVAA